jgi:hypothetical protein
MYRRYVPSEANFITGRTLSAPKYVRKKASLVPSSKIVISIVATTIATFYSSSRSMVNGSDYPTMADEFHLDHSIL